MDDHEYIPASKRVGPPSPWVILADALHPLRFRSLDPVDAVRSPLADATWFPERQARRLSRLPVIAGDEQTSLGKAMPLGTAVRYLRCLEERAAAHAHLVPHNRA